MSTFFTLAMLADGCHCMLLYGCIMGCTVYKSCPS